MFQVTFIFLFDSKDEWLILNLIVLIYHTQKNLF